MKGVQPIVRQAPFRAGACGWEGMKSFKE